VAEGDLPNTQATTDDIILTAPASAPNNTQSRPEATRGQPTTDLPHQGGTPGTGTQTPVGAYLFAHRGILAPLPTPPQPTPTTNLPSPPHHPQTPPPPPPPSVHVLFSPSSTHHMPHPHTSPASTITQHPSPPHKPTPYGISHSPQPHSSKTPITYNDYHHTLPESSSQPTQYPTMTMKYHQHPQPLHCTPSPSLHYTSPHGTPTPTCTYSTHLTTMSPSPS
jgi:hypothetical protein